MCVTILFSVLLSKHCVILFPQNSQPYIPSYVMSVNMNADLRRRLRHSEIFFRRACAQVFLLNRQVEEATIRFHIADDAGNKVHRYNVRLRLSILEGVRNMFYEFASKKAADIVELQRCILDTDLLSDDGDSDSEMSDLMFGYSQGSDESSDGTYC